MSVVDAELVLTDRDMQRIAALVYERSGIGLHEGKRPLVVARLQKRLRALSLDTFSKYLKYLEQDSSGDELTLLLDSIATNHTYFFREEQHFRILAEKVVPEMRKNRRPLDIWCAASSTGEEPYTIGMTLSDLDPPMDFRMVASDISTKALRAASAAVYKMPAVEKLPIDTLRKYFEKGMGEAAGFARVRKELRSKIQFRQINLLHDDWPVRGPLVAIFCRNVMIYFDKDTQRNILQKFAPLLHGDGLLFVGHSENLHHSADLFRSCQKTVYRLNEKGKAMHG